jgi:hypothetical protein
MAMRKLPVVLLLSLLIPARARAVQGPRIEVAFVLDATGSMGPWIDAARQKIESIANDLASGDPAPDVRFGLVLYRDKGDAFVTKTHDFTRSIDEMHGWLNATRADGGGDTPESVLEGLKAGIVELGWSPDDGNSVKLLYLVGDAEPHHYKDSPSEKWLADEALKRGIVMHTIACGSMEGNGQKFFEEMARRTEGRPFRLTDAVRRGTGARRSREISAAGATSASSLGAAVSGSARAYSSALGIAYKPSSLPPIAFTGLATPYYAGATGLLGAQVRLIADQAAWTDLWAAHTSLASDASEGRRPAPPLVDFQRVQVLVLGGADAGLDLVKLETGDGVRWATVRAGAPGVRFLVVPADKSIVITKGGAS